MVRRIPGDSRYPWVTGVDWKSALPELTIRLNRQNNPAIQVLCLMVEGEGKMMDTESRFEQALLWARWG